jgi:hypothetical protein
MLTYDVYKAYKKREVVVSSFKQHEEIKMEHRKILLHWLKDLVQRAYEDDEKDTYYYDLELEIAYASIGIIDKYLSTNTIKLKRYQLLGISSLFLAWKFFSRDYCRLSLKKKDVYSCIYLCCDMYTKKDFLDMEMELLRSLDFHIEPGNISNILMLLWENDLCCKKVVERGRKILWVLFLSGETLKYKPTVIASSILYISKAEENVKPHWTKRSIHMTKYGLKKLQKCICDIYKLL